MDELARRIGGRLAGDGSIRIRGLAPLAHAGPEDLSFYASSRYAAELRQTRAGAVLTAELLPNVQAPQILLADPFLGMNELIPLFYPLDEPDAPPGISPLATVAPSAQTEEGVRILPFAYVGEDASIGARSTVHPGVYVGKGVRLGEDCVLWPNVVVRASAQIGSRVIIQAGAVVGSDGFGYARREGKYIRIRHVGTVVIEDDVEIGANATIDRATLGRTVIRRGVKLDNLVHIGHNVEVGEDTVMAAQCGISGSTVIGKRVMMGGQVGLVDHLRVGDEAMFIAQSGVIGNVPAGAKVSGYPARPHREVLQAQADMRTLRRLRQKVRALEEQLSRLTHEQS